MSGRVGSGREGKLSGRVGFGNGWGGSGRIRERSGRVGSGFEKAMSGRVGLKIWTRCRSLVTTLSRTSPSGLTPSGRFGVMVANWGSVLYDMLLYSILYYTVHKCTSYMI